MFRVRTLILLITPKSENTSYYHSPFSKTCSFNKLKYLNSSHKQELANPYNLGKGLNMVYNLSNITKTTFSGFKFT